MKTSLVSKSILAMFFFLVCGMSMSAVSPKNYLYDTKEENGKIVSKTIFVEKEGLLNQQMRYEFAYNEEGKVSEKKAYRWNKESKEWDPFFVINYQYNTENETIHSVYKMWNKKAKDYNLHVQEMTTSVSAYDEIFS